MFIWQNGRFQILILSLTLWLLAAITACAPAEPAQRTPTQQEVEQFVSQQQLLPVAVAEQEASAIVLYDNGAGASMGLMTVAVLEENGAFSWDGVAVDSGEGIQALSVLAQKEGAAPLVAVLIHEAELARQVQRIEVTFANGVSETADSNGLKGVILFAPQPNLDWTTVTLLDEAGEAVEQVAADEGA